MRNQNTLDTREVMTGKDGKLFVEVDGVQTFLAEVTNFAVNMSVNSTNKQPVGSILVHDIPTGVAFELTFTEMVIRDDVVMAPLLNAINEGWLPTYNFSGVTEKPDGQQQQITFDNAVPKGNFPLMKVTPGEVIEGERSFALNKIPRYLSTISSIYIK